MLSLKNPCVLSVVLAAAVFAYQYWWNYKTLVKSLVHGGIAGLVVYLLACWCTSRGRSDDTIYIQTGDSGNSEQFSVSIRPLTR